jgi:hypothetical protein
MEYWLTNKGSPKCTIDKMIKTNEREIQKLEFKEFRVRKWLLFNMQNLSNYIRFLNNVSQLEQ